MSNPAPTPAPVRAAAVPRDRCGMAIASDLLGDRWTMLIVREALYGVSRFDDLRADLGIPRGVLSGRLKTLVGAGILHKTPYRDGSTRLRHDYRLSDAGRALALPLLALMQWGDRHLQHRPSPLRLVSRATGEPVHIGFVSASGQPIAADAVAYAIDPT